MLKDILSYSLAGGCSGAACQSAGVPWLAVALVVILFGALGAVIIFGKHGPTPALARRRAHDHLIPSAARSYRARRA